MTATSKLGGNKHFLTADDFQGQMNEIEKDETVDKLLDLSVLEICLMIAVKHHCEIYEIDEMNFEMVYTRYVKFANSNSGINVVQRSVVMKAFEHLEVSEFTTDHFVSNIKDSRVNVDDIHVDNYCSRINTTLDELLIVPRFRRDHNSTIFKQKLELICSTATSISKLQKEYEMFKLSAIPKHIEEAVKRYLNLPVEVAQWANNPLSV